MASTGNGRVRIIGKAAIYTRVSTDRQQDGASLDVQLEACRNYCEAHGLVVVAEFRDVLSGLNPERPQYRQAVELARSKSVDKLVVWRFDRLGRDAAEYMTQLRDLRKLGIDVVSVTQPGESAFMQQLWGILAEQESRDKSVRITAARERRFREGKWNGQVPLGYSAQRAADGGNILVPNSDALLVTEMFNQYASGRYSLTDLRRFLREAGHPKSIFGIRYILSNSTYIGMVRRGRYFKSKFHPKQEMVETKGLHQPLVDQATFDKVQARLAANQARVTRGRPPSYLFSGITYCGNCGRRFSAKRVNTGKRPTIQYICNRRFSFGDCKSHSVSDGRLREAVLKPIATLLGRLSQSEIRKAVRDELLRQQAAREAATQATIAELEHHRQRLETRLARLEDSYLDEIISKDRYLVRRDELLAELDGVEAKLGAHPRKQSVDVEGLLDMASALEGAPLDENEQRVVVSETVEKILVDGRDIHVHWKPDYAPLMESVAEKQPIS